MILGIDASNIRAGGGVTHLVELLRASDPNVGGFSKVIVWACKATLDQLEDYPWLIKKKDPLLDRNLFMRLFWQRFLLKAKAKKSNCDLLFVPGGNNVSGFQPAATMSQNMLPFEWGELFRFGFSIFTLRFILLRFSQSRSFKRSNGVIFLTQYAKNGVEKVTGKLLKRTAVIPHGINSRFYLMPRPQRKFEEFTEFKPCRAVYVSIVHLYKHQWNVVEAIAKLRKDGLHIVLDLVGPTGTGSKILADSISKFDPNHEFVTYKGNIPYDDLHELYVKADIGVFASSCENLPNILLENMASGLPVACSNMGPMQEVLLNAGVYFSPEKPVEIAEAIFLLLHNEVLRGQLAFDAYKISQNYTWKKCANDTFLFLGSIASINSQS
jgi:glycosyltransferase involved in cell wall biosynthesis